MFFFSAAKYKIGSALNSETKPFHKTSMFQTVPRDFFILRRFNRVKPVMGISFTVLDFMVFLFWQKIFAMLKIE